MPYTNLRFERVVDEPVLSLADRFGSFMPLLTLRQAAS